MTRASLPVMASTPIKFHIPDECRTFTLFPRLPPELRQQIWRTALSVPGIQFVKLETRGRSWRLVSLSRSLPLYSAPSGSGNANENDEIAIEVKHEVAPKPIWDTQLIPIAPTRLSDISSYCHLHRRLSTLALTCKESLATARSLTSRPGILRLGNGAILSLANSSDVIFLDYFPPELYQSGCGFGLDPNCPDLNLIRRVAVRFCHQWQEKIAPSVCSLCGQVHDTSRRAAYPAHLYHVLARHLPNLEEFYFVDYFILRRDKAELVKETRPGSTRRARNGDSPTASLGIKCGNRTFYEANETEWDIKPQVLRLKSWLQDRFVRYATTSHLSRHRSPEKVRFGIMACEWSISPPVSLPMSQPQPHPLPRAQKSRPKKRPRRDDSDLRRLRLRRQGSFGARETKPTRMDTSVPFVFGNTAQNMFEFTFRVPLGGK